MIHFYIQSNSGLTAITNSFTSLRTIQGNFYMTSNGRLNNIGSSFTSLQTVTGNWYVYSNSALTSVGSAFQALQRISGTVRFYSNGGRWSSQQRAFCQSVDQYVCPASTSRSTSGGTYGASGCCNTFCASSTAC